MLDKVISYLEKPTYELAQYLAKQTLSSVLRATKQNRVEILNAYERHLNRSCLVVVTPVGVYQMGYVSRQVNYALFCEDAEEWAKTGNDYLPLLKRYIENDLSMLRHHLDTDNRRMFDYHIRRLYYHLCDYTFNQAETKFLAVTTDDAWADKKR